MNELGWCSDEAAASSMGGGGSEDPRQGGAGGNRRLLRRFYSRDSALFSALRFLPPPLARFGALLLSLCLLLPSWSHRLTLISAELAEETLLSWRRPFPLGSPSPTAHTPSKPDPCPSFLRYRPF